MSSDSMKLNDLPSCIDDTDTIKVWQRYLKSIGMLSSVSGHFDEPTEAATADYGRKIYRSGEDVYVMSFERPDRDYYEKSSEAHLTSEIEEPLKKIAYGYFILRGKTLHITSGRRTPEKQAELMYEKARWGKTGLSIYKNHRLADEVWTAYENARNAHAGKQAEIDAVAATIREQVSQGDYVSSHLSGRAFDIRLLDGCDRTCFELMVKLVFGTTQGHLIENEGRGSEKHFHVQF